MPDPGSPYIAILPKEGMEFVAPAGPEAHGIIKNQVKAALVCYRRISQTGPIADYAMHDE